jgi:hypothetical protein
MTINLIQSDKSIQTLASEIVNEGRDFLETIESEFLNDEEATELCNQVDKLEQGKIKKIINLHIDG